MNEALDIFQEWRVADRVAQEAERRAMREAMDGYDEAGREPTSQTRDDAHRLRSIANDLFAVAMAELKRRSEQLRR